MHIVAFLVDAEPDDRCLRDRAEPDGKLYVRLGIILLHSQTYELCFYSPVLVDRLFDLV